MNFKSANKDIISTSQVSFTNRSIISYIHDVRLINAPKIHVSWNIKLDYKLHFRSLNMISLYVKNTRGIIRKLPPHLFVYHQNIIRIVVFVYI